MSATIKVGIADLNVAQSPDILVTYALGSCVGICLYDRVKKIAGLSHIMLPDSTVTHGAVQIARFADTAIPKLVQQMVARGATKRVLTAKIAGWGENVCLRKQQLPVQHWAAECAGGKGGPGEAGHPHHRGGYGKGLRTDAVL